MLDQWFKVLVENSFKYGQSLAIIEDIFHLTYVKNTGAAFGILKGNTTFFIVISVIIIIGFLVFLKYLNYNSIWIKLATGLIIGGAIGNLVDRIRLGYVIDYLDFRIWPVFNLADSAVVIGTIILVIFIWNQEL
jgi:signal peptidase II